MANHLKMAENDAIVALHVQGWSKRKIARELRIDRGTVRRHLKKCRQSESGETGRREASDEASKAANSGEVQTGILSVQEVAQAASRSKCEALRSQIKKKIEDGLSAQRIFQDIQSEHNFDGAYSSVQRMVQRLSAGRALPFRRLECGPGEEAQADFGTGAPIADCEGKRRHSQVLRISLSYSRKGYSEAFFKQDTESWLSGWENAFWAWGGAPRILQIDNTKAAVNRADWYDPDIHPIILSFCKHYGTVLMPVKAGTPRHNGKAESNIDYVKNNALKGRTFATLSAENEHLIQWESRIADQRIHGTTKKQVRKLFEEQERSALLPLPAMRFAFYKESKRIAHRDGHVEVAKAYYSVPPEYMGNTVWVRWDSHMVRILNIRFEEIALHARQEEGRFRTNDKHLSSRKIALVERGSDDLLRRARLIGQQTGRWAEAMLKERGIVGVRVLVGLVSLTKHHSSPVIEKACELALGHGQFRLRGLKSLIKDPVEQEQLEFMSEHPIIRSLQEYGTTLRVHFGNPWEESGGSQAGLN